MRFSNVEERTAFVAPADTLKDLISFSKENDTPTWEIFIAQDELEGGTYQQVGKDKLKLKDAYLFSLAFSELAEEGIRERNVKYPSLSLFLSEAIQNWLAEFWAVEEVAKAA